MYGNERAAAYASPTQCVTLSPRDLNGPASPLKGPDVPREIDRAQKASAVYHELVQRLGEKLSCLVIQEPTSGVNGDACIEAVLSPLASDIRSIGGRVEESNALLSRLIDRLQI
jgi:uncharacterized membrane protein YdfJ with MMPL/SSD domain